MTYAVLAVSLLASSLTTASSEPITTRTQRLPTDLGGAHENGGHQGRGPEERKQGGKGSLEQDQREEAGAGEGQHRGSHERRGRPPELLEDESAEDHHDESHRSRRGTKVALQKGGGKSSSGTEKNKK